jgi:hypothetical protein
MTCLLSHRGAFFTWAVCAMLSAYSLSALSFHLWVYPLRIYFQPSTLSLTPNAFCLQLWAVSSALCPNQVTTRSIKLFAFHVWTTHSLRSLETRRTQREIRFSWSGDDDQEKSSALRAIYIPPIIGGTAGFHLPLPAPWNAKPIPLGSPGKWKNGFLGVLRDSSEWNERAVNRLSERIPRRFCLTPVLRGLRG